MFADSPSCSTGRSVFSRGGGDCNGGNACSSSGGLYQKEAAAAAIKRRRRREQRIWKQAKNRSCSARARFPSAKKWGSKSGNSGNYSCKTWIWADLVSCYVERMIRFRSSVAQAQMEALQKEIEKKKEEANYMELELIEQGLAHQLATSEFKLKISSLESQLDKQISIAKKFKKLRLLMLLFVAACWLTSPSSLLITLAATGIIAVMYVV